jgi:hypothetical protein
MGKDVAVRLSLLSADIRQYGSAVQPTASREVTVQKSRSSLLQATPLAQPAAAAAAAEQTKLGHLHRHQQPSSVSTT